MTSSIIFAVACSLVALGFAYLNIRWVMEKPDGSNEMRAISKAIEEGASAYFKRQLRTLGRCVNELHCIRDFYAWIRGKWNIVQ